MTSKAIIVEVDSDGDSGAKVARASVGFAGAFPPEWREFSVAASSKRHPSDPYDKFTGDLIASARALRLVAAELEAQAAERMAKARSRKSNGNVVQLTPTALLGVALSQQTVSVISQESLTLAEAADEAIALVGAGDSAEEAPTQTANPDRTTWRDLGRERGEIS